jgi:hypothetical protein
MVNQKQQGFLDALMRDYHQKKEEKVLLSIECICTYTRIDISTFKVK